MVLCGGRRRVVVVVVLVSRLIEGFRYELNLEQLSLLNERQTVDKGCLLVLLFRLRPDI